MAIAIAEAFVDHDCEKCGSTIRYFRGDWHEYLADGRMRVKCPVCRALYLVSDLDWEGLVSMDVRA